MADSEQKYKSPALDKGLDILELLCLEKKPMAMNEIASRLGRTRSEIFRMALTLERRDYIYRPEGSDSYTLTIKLFEMGMNHPPNRTLQEVALPLMKELTQISNQSCYLAVVSQYEHIITIASTEAPGYMGFSVRTGHQEPVLPTAAGHVMYAFMPPVIQEEWLKRFQQLDDRNFNPASYERRAKKIKKAGYELRPNNKIDGVIDICAPVMDAVIDGAQASLVIPFIRHSGLDAEKEKTVDIVVDTAKRITEGLNLVDSSS